MGETTENGWSVLRTFLREYKWPLCVVGVMVALQQQWIDVPIFDAVFRWVVEVMKAGADLIPGV